IRASDNDNSATFSSEPSVNAFCKPPAWRIDFARARTAASFAPPPPAFLLVSTTRSGVAIATLLMLPSFQFQRTLFGRLHSGVRTVPRAGFFSFDKARRKLRSSDIHIDGADPAANDECRNDIGD